VGAGVGATKEGKMAPNFSQATPDRALRFSIISAVNRNVGGSNPPRGANPLVLQLVTDDAFPFDQNVVSVPEFSQRKLLPFLQKPNVFDGKIIENVPSIRLLTESPPALRDGSKNHMWCVPLLGSFNTPWR